MRRSFCTYRPLSRNKCLLDSCKLFLYSCRVLLLLRLTGAKIRRIVVFATHDERFFENIFHRHKKARLESTRPGRYEHDKNAKGSAECSNEVPRKKNARCPDREVNEHRRPAPALHHEQCPRLFQPRKNQGCKKHPLELDKVRASVVFVRRLHGVRHQPGRIHTPGDVQALENFICYHHLPFCRSRHRSGRGKMR